MVPAENKAKSLSKVNHTTKQFIIIHHHRSILGEEKTLFCEHMSVSQLTSLKYYPKMSIVTLTYANFFKFLGGLPLFG